MSRTVDAEEIHGPKTMRPEVRFEHSRVAVLPVTTGGSSLLSSEELQQSRDAIFRVFHSRNEFEIVESEQGCETAKCWQSLPEARRVNFILYPETELGLESNRLMTSIVVVDGDSGLEVGRFDRDCEPCSRSQIESEMSATAMMAAIEILRIRVIATPPRPSRNRASVVKTAVGASIMGVGILTIIAGTIVLSINGRRADCVPDPRYSECLPLRYATAAPGGALLGIGTALTVAGSPVFIIGLLKMKTKRAALSSIGSRSFGIRVKF